MAKVPEKASPATLAGPQEWGWVDRTIWTDRMLTALGNGVRGGRWHSLIDKVYRRTTLEAAWRQVQANQGAAGVDRVSCERFAAQENRYLDELEEQLKSDGYRPEGIRRVYLPKPNGKRRPLGIPTVKDRIVQGAVKRVIEPIFEQLFEDSSYGFRPGRGCKDALREVDQLIKEGYTHVVDADLAGYFDSIPHTALMERVKERISDSRVLKLLEMWIKQDIVEDLQRWTPNRGTPQGAVISPLLANLYLHPLDERLRNKGYRMIRYADDFVVLCPSAEQARQAYREVETWVEANGLELNREKTHIGDCREPGQGFEFLGYRFEGGRRWIRKASRQALKAKIRAKTRRTCGQGLERVIADLNPMLRGWFAYFKHANRWEYPALDGFVRRRLRAILRKQEKRPGRGRCHADHRRWPNAFFAQAGLFTMTGAWHAASQSR